MFQANKGFSTANGDAYVAGLGFALETSSMPTLVPLLLDDLDLDYCMSAAK